MLCADVINGVLTPVAVCSGSSYRLMLEGDLNSPFVLSASDGLSLAWQIGAVWLAAFTVKMLIKALNGGDPER